MKPLSQTFVSEMCLACPNHDKEASCNPCPFNDIFQRIGDALKKGESQEESPEQIERITKDKKDTIGPTAAIRYYKSVTGCGLKDAYVFVKGL